MSKSSSIGDMQFNLIAQQPAVESRPDPEAPFRIAILGDYSGRANRHVKHSLASRPIAVDCDNLDSVLGKLNVTLHLPVAGSSDERIELRFGELEDFHPDRIYNRLELFQAIKKTRKDLLNASTFDAAAAEVRSWAQLSDESPATAANDAPIAEWSDSSSLNPPDNDSFAQLLGKPAVIPETVPQPRSSSPVAALLKQIVGPYIVPSADPHQNALVEAVDAATSKQMRMILHDPAFQALESAWRSLDYLVRNLETDEQLKLYLMDISKAELADDLASCQDLSTTGTYKLLFEEAVGMPGGQPWAVVVGDYTFDATANDANMLGRIATIATHARSPFLAKGHSRLLGCESFTATPSPENWTCSMDAQATEAWDAVRRLKQASSIGLAMPGFMLRLPYGAQTDPIDSFEFEEIEGSGDDGIYLWGNPAFICAYLLGQEFGQQGWRFTPGSGMEIDDLPAHTYKQDGESKMTPCAEAWLSDSTASQILDKGFMPLLSIQNRDGILFSRFQSIAEPAKNLAGRWGS